MSVAFKAVEREQREAALPGRSGRRRNRLVQSHRHMQRRRLRAAGRALLQPAALAVRALRSAACEDEGGAATGLCADGPAGLPRLRLAPSYIVRPVRTIIAGTLGRMQPRCQQ